MKSWFVKIPEKLFTFEKAGPLVATYVGVMSYGSSKGYAYPSISTVAKDLKWSPWKITSKIETLKKLKILFTNKIENNHTYWGAKTKNEECIFLPGPFIRYFLQKTDFSGEHLSIYALITYNENKGRQVNLLDLAKYCCVSEGKLCSYLKELIKTGFINKIKTQRTNAYTINHSKEKLVSALPKINSFIDTNNCFFCGIENATKTIQIEEITVKCCNTCFKNDYPKSLTQIVENIIKNSLTQKLLVRKLTNSLLGLLQKSDFEEGRPLKINTDIEFTTKDIETLTKIIGAITKGKNNAPLSTKPY